MSARCSPRTYTVNLDRSNGCCISEDGDCSKCYFIAASDNDGSPRKNSPQKEAEVVVPASKRMKGRKSAPIKAEKTNESSPEAEKPKKPAKPAARVTRAAKAAKDGQQAEREVAEILLSEIQFIKQHFTSFRHSDKSPFMKYLPLGIGANIMKTLSGRE